MFIRHVINLQLVIQSCSNRYDNAVTIECQEKFSTHSNRLLTGLVFFLIIPQTYHFTSFLRSYFFT
nr:MAG TPA: hypothetical protein [Bacteriophage sp.]